MLTTLILCTLELIKTIERNYSIELDSSFLHIRSENCLHISDFLKNIYRILIMAFFPLKNKTEFLDNAKKKNHYFYTFYMSSLKLVIYGGRSLQIYDLVTNTLTE